MKPTVFDPWRKLRPADRNFGRPAVDFAESRPVLAAHAADAGVRLAADQSSFSPIP